MKRIIASLFAATLAVAPFPAQADQNLLTGNDLLEHCSNAGGWSEGFCDGFISGIAEFLSTTNKICPPQGVTQRQMWDIVILYLKNNPRDRELDPAYLTTLAIQRAYPCPK